MMFQKCTTYTSVVPSLHPIHSFIHSFSHSISKYLLSTHDMPASGADSVGDKKNTGVCVAHLKVANKIKTECIKM